MRLWTFQSKNCLDVLKDGSWYLYSTSPSRIKEIDKSLAKDDVLQVVGLPPQNVKRLPVYTFARMPEMDTLSLGTFVQQCPYLTGKMNMHMIDTIMLELEVPEQFFLLMRDTDDTESEGIKSGYFEYLRNATESVEVLLPRVMRDWVVSYKTFHYYFGFSGFEVRTEIVNEHLLPAWTETVYISNNTQVYWKNEIENLVHEGYMNYKWLVDKYGMEEPCDYFTIKEALQYCNSKAINSFISDCKRFGVLKDFYAETTIEDIKNRRNSSESLGELFSYFDKS